MVNSLELKALLIKNELSQTKIAKMLNISQVSFNRKLNNHVEFKASEIQKLCFILNIDNYTKIFAQKSELNSQTLE